MLGGGLVAGPVDAGASGLVLGDGAFDDPGADPERRAGSRLARTWRPMVPTRSMTVSAMTPAAWMSWSRAAAGDGEAGPVGIGAGPGAGGVGHGGAQQLVGDQQGVDLLLDAVGGAGAQDPAAQDGGLEFQVGGFDLPPLVIEADESAAGWRWGSSRVVTSR